MKINQKQILVIVATLGVILINYFAAQGYINNITPQIISNKYPTLITPAGYAFAIWSLIYLGLIGFSIYQALPSQTDNPRFKNVRSLYIVNLRGKLLVDLPVALRYDFGIARRDVRFARNARFDQRQTAKRRNFCRNVAGANSVQPIFRLDYGGDDFELFRCAGFSRREYERGEFGNFKRDFNRRGSRSGNFD